MSVAAARLLPATSETLIRFTPKLNFNGTVTLDFHAWDQTQGSSSIPFDLSGDGKVGGSTAFSQAVEQATLTITHVNDAPRLLPVVGSTVSHQRGTSAVRPPTTTRNIEFMLTDPSGAVSNRVNATVNVT